jgi:predicted MFS family arabinose efflux permease
VKGALDIEKKRDMVILFALSFSIFSIYPSNIVSSLTLIELGYTFNASIGVVGQLRTFSSLVALVSALIMGVLSVKTEPKKLLLAGLVFLSLSALGSASSLNLGMLFFFFSISGLGIAMVEPMVGTLVASHFPLDRRARVIGTIAAGGGLSFIIGGYVVGFLVEAGGWRMAFMGFAALLPLIGLLLISKTIPLPVSYTPLAERGLTEGLRAIVSSPSAMGCLLGNLLASASLQGLYFYSFSFLRERYSISPGFASIIYSLTSVFFFLGSLLSGRFIDYWGRRRVLYIGLISIGVSTILYANIPYAVWCMVFMMVGHFFCAFQWSASNSLSLEQIPQFRGSMMSMNSAAVFIGYAFGSGIGGLTLLFSSWEVLSIVLGILSIAGALIYYLLTKDPTL